MAKVGFQAVWLIFCVVFSDVAASIGTAQEPVCTSRFDYDHKMLQKMLMLEIEQNTIKQAIGELKEFLAKQTETGKEMQNAFGKMTSKLQRIETLSSFDGSGSTYVRWGRISCPWNGTEQVYKGFAAGSNHNKGAASSYLCLPEDPTWGVYDDTAQDSGTIWGAEYEFLYRNEYTFFGKSLKERDVPCSVCRTKRASVLMIPGRNVCYGGWTMEYKGYLMAGHDTHHATDFVCVDQEPEALIGGGSNENGKLFYFTEGRCGSLRCPPYVHGRELTCSVCTK
ncbi:uncharacterized protein LOC123532375 [Mercenaria mercenaria]|uniref:uncharacterized protein LOC123532375 n=1 Tax=Mercenaria mercenaria TaxID=6596 RepID=UPI00234E9274|nr:uncharacterized protein LOC123532375 [Mercenaria mercenaria]